jgi:hypothetical protein
LNAVEIMKLDNRMGSLAGKVPVEFIMKSWPRPQGKYGSFGCCCLFAGNHIYGLALEDDWVKGLCYMVKITCGCFRC